MEEGDAKWLLEGEIDVWLSSCRDSFNSPFGTSGQACPVPFWSCLNCSNAVITLQKMPASWPAWTTWNSSASRCSRRRSRWPTTAPGSGS